MKRIFGVSWHTAALAGRAQAVRTLAEATLEPLYRFCLYRVGRDLPRKLAPDDRMIGALRLQLDQGIEPAATCRAIGAALLFRATDEHRQLFERAAEFVRDWYPRGVATILTGLCGLDPARDDHRRAMDAIAAAHETWQE